MALDTTIPIHGTNIVPTGITLTLIPRDVTARIELQRTGQSGGQPDTGSAVTIAEMDPGPAGGTTYIDSLPLDNVVRYYRYRHVGLGKDPSGWSEWSEALTPEQLDRVLPEFTVQEHPASDVLRLGGRVEGQQRTAVQPFTYLVPNAEFDIWESEAQPHAWSVDTGDASAVARDTAVVFSGDAAAKFAFGAGGSAGTYRGLTTNDPTKGGFCVPLKPGVTYRIKLSVRCSSIAGVPDYRLTFTHNVAASLTSVRTFPLPAATTWQTDEFIFTVPAGAEPNSKLAIEFKRGNTTAQDFWVDSVRMDEVGQRFRCKAYHSALQAIATATLTLVAFDSEEYDEGSLHDTVTNNGRITIPKGGDTGQWILVAQVHWGAATGATGGRAVRIRKNGTLVIAANQVAGWPVANTQDSVQTAIAVLDAPAVGDYFEVLVYQDSGVSLNLGAGTGHVTFFQATHTW